MTLDVAQSELVGADNRRGQQRRRIIVTVLTVLLAVAAITVIALAFAQGSWWYAYGTDRALDRESRARVEAMRDEVEGIGTADQAVVWLNAALEPNTHPTDVRAYLITAQEMLEETSDPELAQIAEELGGIIKVIRPTIKRPPSFEATSTPYSAPTLELSQ